jgi:hypothetical protein
MSSGPERVARILPSSWLQIDPNVWKKEDDKNSILQKHITPSLPTFLLAWILSYTLLGRY